MLDKVASQYAPDLIEEVQELVHGVGWLGRARQDLIEKVARIAGHEAWQGLALDHGRNHHFTEDLFQFLHPCVKDIVFQALELKFHGRDELFKVLPADRFESTRMHFAFDFVFGDANE